MASSPVLLIGLDGVDFRYLDRFSDSLTHIDRVRKAGIEAPLRSTHPPWTGSAWPSMYTGVGPSYHGVYDFFDKRVGYPDQADVVTRRDVRAPAIWNDLTEIGRRSVVLNVPITHPADELDGVLMPGYLAPADEDGYPPGIRTELSEALGRQYAIYSAYETDPESAKKTYGYERLIQNRARAAEYLLETKSWDFAFIQVQKTDAVFHNSSSEQDFRRIYEAADELVGRLVRACDGEPNVLLCSDHGIGPVDGYRVYINEVLRSHGFVETTSDSGTMGLAEVKGNDTTEETRLDATLRELGRLSRRIGVSPGAVYNVARKFGLEHHLLRIAPSSVLDSVSQGVDWRRSEAFCRRSSEQGVRINLEGRDPDGVVPADRYDAVRNRIIEILSDLETDEGESVFEFVSPREELYDGPYLEDACDILFRPTDMNHVVSPDLYGSQTLSVDTYDHKETGVFVASGPDIPASWTEPELSILDIAPIVFSLLDEPVPARMVGTVPDALSGSPVARRTYDGEPTGDEGTYAQDQDEVTERLSDLGYL